MTGREAATEATPQPQALRLQNRLRVNAPSTLAGFARVVMATILRQGRGNAYWSEFGGYPDEPAHYVTGLMIRDYVASGFPGSPVAYAENYYLHYPKVAFGIWGPLLHFTEAAWTLVFPPSRASMLALM